jgi:hypothetical protein
MTRRQHAWESKWPYEICRRCRMRRTYASERRWRYFWVSPQETYQISFGHLGGSCPPRFIGKKKEPYDAR